MLSAKINGDWMLLKGAKFKPRDIKEGDTVEVDFTTNERGYKDINKGGLKLASVQPTKTDAPSTAGKAAVPYKDPRQTIISTQAALNTAIAFVTVAAANGVLPAMTGKANDKLSLFRTWVLNEAAGFYKLSTGEELVIPEAASVADAELPVKPKAKKPAKVEPEYEDETGEDEYPDED
jgi:hypothetical protein